MKLPLDYYENEDVETIANSLIGKYLFSKIEGQLSGGIITKTEVVDNEVIICAIKATHVEELMLKRTRKFRMNDDVTNTPEKINIALGINDLGNDTNLGNKIWIENRIPL